MSRLFGACRRLRAGQALFNTGDPFGSLFNVRAGAFKLSLTDAEGREQVMAFRMTGELLGVEGLATGRHSVSAVALRDSLTSALPHESLERHTRGAPALARELHTALSREIEQRQRVLLLLDSLRGDERLAAFLHDFALRCGGGTLALEFELPMTRKDIGSYLGLSLEKVSRLLSALHPQGTLRIRGKRVCVLDRERLRALAGAVPALL